MRVGDVAKTLEVERWWSVRGRDRGRWCFDRDIGGHFVVDWSKRVADHLFLDNDVGPFLIFHDRR